MAVRKDRIYDDGYEWTFNEEGMVQCPVCGEFSFDEPDDNTMCEVCGWINCETQFSFPDTFHGPLHMTFHEAQRAYAEGRPIE